MGRSPFAAPGSGKSKGDMLAAVEEQLTNPRQLTAERADEFGRAHDSSTLLFREMAKDRPDLVSPELLVAIERDRRKLVECARLPRRRRVAARALPRSRGTGRR